MIVPMRQHIPQISIRLPKRRICEMQIPTQRHHSGHCEISLARIGALNSISAGRCDRSTAFILIDGAIGGEGVADESVDEIGPEILLAGGAIVGGVFFEEGVDLICFPGFLGEVVVCDVAGVGDGEVAGDCGGDGEGGGFVTDAVADEDDEVESSYL